MADYGKYIVGSVNGYDIEIWRKDWEDDEVNPSALSASGLKLKLIDGDFDNRISRTTVDVTFHDANFKSYYHEFFTADATKYKLLIYKGDDLVWSGYVTPDSYSYSSDVPVTITARDNVGYLEQIDFDLSGFKTINEILTEAQSRIAWQPSAWVWVGAYTAENGTVEYGESVIDCDYFEGTWYEMLDALLAGYQLRYIGANTWKIFEITQLADLSTIEPEISFDAITYEVIPSWNTVTVEQDYGVKEDLFEYAQKESDFTYDYTPDTPVHTGDTSGYTRAPLYKNSSLNDASVLNNYLYSNADMAADTAYGVILLAYSTVTVDVNTSDYDFEFSPDVTPIVLEYNYGPSTNAGLQIKISIYDYPIGQSEDGKSIFSFNPFLHTPWYYGSIPMTQSLLAYVTYTSINGDVYHMNTDGWGDDEYLIKIDKEISENNYTYNSLITDTTEFTINVATLPDIAGTLRVTLSATCNITYDNTGGTSISAHAARDVNAMGITAITIEPQLTTDNSIELIGLINESGNTKESITVDYGETPTNIGGIGTMAYGLFYQFESLTNWQRADEEGGVINLTENIGRAYAHLSNAFYQGSERCGGLIVTATIPDFTPANIAIDDKSYALTSYTWTLTTDRAQITAREVTPYEYDSPSGDCSECTENVVSKSSSAYLASSSTSVVYWGDVGSGIGSAVRLYELDTETDTTASYLLVDKRGNDSAKKIAISSLADIVGSSLSGIFLSSVDADTAEGHITFNDGITVDDIKSSEYQSTIKAGYRLYVDENGRGVLDINKILAEELIVDVLTYNKVQAIGGTFLISKAWATLSRYTVSDEGVVRIYYEPDDKLQMWRVGDQPYMVNAGRLFWGIVTDVSDSEEADEHWFECEGDDEDVDYIGSKSFVEGDEFVLRGYRGDDDNSRQNFIVLSASGDYPTIAAYKGVDSFTIGNSNLAYEFAESFRVSASSFIIASSLGEDTTLEETLEEIRNIADSDNEETIYTLSASSVTSTLPTLSNDADTDGYVPDGWYDDMQNVTSTTPYQFAASRKRADDNTWGDFGNIILYNSMGIAGREPATIYKTASSQPSKPTSLAYPPEGWSLTATAATEEATVAAVSNSGDMAVASISSIEEAEIVEEASGVSVMSADSEIATMSESSDTINMGSVFNSSAFGLFEVVKPDGTTYYSYETEGFYTSGTISIPVLEGTFILRYTKYAGADDAGYCRITPATSTTTASITITSDGWEQDGSRYYAYQSNMTAGETVYLYITFALFATATGVTLNKSTTSIVEGSTETLVATVSPSDAEDKTVSWSSSNTSVATVSSSGVVTAVSAGSATITVTTTDGSYTASCVVTVLSTAVTGVTLDQSTMTLVVGGSQTLYATVSPSYAVYDYMIWDVWDSSIVSVSDSGVVTATNPGSTTIDVHVGSVGSDDFVASCEVTVQTNAVSVTGVSVSPTTASMMVGETQNLTATITPSNATNTAVSWSSSDTSVATVSAAGVVTAVGGGASRVTATTSDGSYTAYCTISVTAESTDDGSDDVVTRSGDVIWACTGVWGDSITEVDSWGDVVQWSGDPGAGVASIITYYARSSSNTTEPTLWYTTQPTLTSVYRYLWSYTKTTLTDGTIIETEKGVIGSLGIDGIDTSSYLAEVFVEDTTLDVDGIVFAQFMAVKDTDGNVTGGFSGGQATGLPMFFIGAEGGTVAQANAAMVAFQHNGSGHLASGNIAWDVDGNADFNGIISAAAGSSLGAFTINADGTIQSGSDGTGIRNAYLYGLNIAPLIKTSSFSIGTNTCSAYGVSGSGTYTITLPYGDSSGATSGVRNGRVIFIMVKSGTWNVYPSSGQSLYDGNEGGEVSSRGLRVGLNAVVGLDTTGSGYIDSWYITRAY